MQSETETKAPVVKRTIPKKQMGFLAVAFYAMQHAMQHPDKNFAEIFKLKESPDAICDHVKKIIDDAELAKSVNELRKKLIAKPRKQAVISEALSEAAKEIVELARSNDMDTASATATATTTATASATATMTATDTMTATVSKKRKAAPKKHPTTPDASLPDISSATVNENQVIAAANASIESSVQTKKRKAASADGEAPKPKAPRKAKVPTQTTQPTDNVVTDAVVADAVVADA